MANQLMVRFWKFGGVGGVSKKRRFKKLSILLSLERRVGVVLHRGGSLSQWKVVWFLASVALIGRRALDRVEIESSSVIFHTGRERARTVLFLYFSRFLPRKKRKTLSRVSFHWNTEKKREMAPTTCWNLRVSAEANQGMDWLFFD